MRMHIHTYIHTYIPQTGAFMLSYGMVPPNLFAAISMALGFLDGFIAQLG